MPTPSPPLPSHPAASAPSASSPPPLPRPPASPRNPPAAAATADRVKKINTVKEFTAALAVAKDRLVVVEFATTVKMVAKLDEPEEQNYVRKHARQQAEELGVSMREAATRIFSNASGSYSSNVRDCEIGYED